jgi:molybdopterin synthase sulfur carrier subunit
VVLDVAATVGAAVQELSRRFPGLKERLLDDQGSLRRSMNLFRNDEDVRAIGGLAAGLKDGDRLSIVAAIAGG